MTETYVGIILQLSEDKMQVLLTNETNPDIPQAIHWVSNTITESKNIYPGAMFVWDMSSSRSKFWFLTYPVTPETLTIEARANAYYKWYNTVDESSHDVWKH